MTVSLNHLGDLARKRVAVAAYYFVLHDITLIVGI